MCLSLSLGLQSCSLFTGDSEKRSREWELFTAQGLSAEREQKYDEAAVKYKQALSIAEQFSRSDLRRTMTAIDLASALHKQGNDADALLLLEQARDAYEKWAPNRSDDEAINRIGSKMASGYRALGEIYASHGQNEEAEKAYEKALALTKEAYFSNRFRRELSAQYAALLAKTGKTDKARALVAPAAAVSEGLAATWERKDLVDKEFADGRATAGELGRKHDWIGAAAVLAKTADLCRTKYGAKDTRVLQLIGEQASNLNYGKKPKEAEKVLRRGIAEHGDKADPTLADAYSKLAEILMTSKQYEHSIQAAQKGVAVAHELGEDGIEGSCYFVIGADCAMSGKNNLAIENYEKGLKIHSAFVYDIPYFDALVSLSELYIQERRLSDAQKALEGAVGMQKKRPPNSVYERTLRTLARVYELQGDPARSKQILAEADRVNPRN